MYITSNVRICFFKKALYDVIMTDFRSKCHFGPFFKYRQIQYTPIIGTLL